MMNEDIILENTYLLTAYLNDIRGLEYSMENKCRWRLSLIQNTKNNSVLDLALPSEQQCNSEQDTVLTSHFNPC